MDTTVRPGAPEVALRRVNKACCSCRYACAAFSSSQLNCNIRNFKDEIRSGVTVHVLVQVCSFNSVYLLCLICATSFKVVLKKVSHQRNA